MTTLTSPRNGAKPSPTTSHTHTADPPTWSSPLNYRAPYPRPRHPSPPTTKGRGKGILQEVWLQAGKGHDRGKRARGWENQTRQPQDAWGRGVGSKPRDLEGVRRRLVTTRQAQSSAHRQPAKADPSGASGGRRRAGTRPCGGEPPPITPHSPPRRDWRIRTMWSAARGKAVVAGTTGKGAGGGVGWGGGGLNSPSPAPNHQT